jgi:hypothetical protein
MHSILEFNLAQPHCGNISVVILHIPVRINFITRRKFAKDGGFWGYSSNGKLISRKK